MVAVAGGGTVLAPPESLGAYEVGLEPYQQRPTYGVDTDKREVYL
jgi:hypothetical protein